MKRNTHYDPHESERMQAVQGMELASFGRRAIAFSLDFLFGGLIFMSPFIIMALLSGRIGDFQFRSSSQAPAEGTVQLNFFKNVFSLIWWALYFGFATYLGKGKTPGKRLLGIRVVSLVHERISLWHSFERALGYAASALEFGFGFMQYFVHPNRRTVHDRIAETIVVRDLPRSATQSATSEEGTAG